jgi:hypothetical protein
LRTPELTITPAVLNGGTLAISAHGTFSNRVAVRESSRMITANSGSYEPQFTGTFNVAAGKTLDIVGSLSVTMRGDTTIDGLVRVANASNVTLLPAAGRTVRGSGDADATLTLSAGGALAPGNSVGEFTVTRANFNGGGAYQFEIEKAQGEAGVAWDLLTLNDSLTVGATSSNRFGLNLISVNANGSPGPLDGFNPTQPFDWTFVSAASINGFALERFSLGTSQFTQFNDLAGGSFTIAQVGNTLAIQFRPIPEPTTAAVMLSVLTCARHARARSHRRRRQCR